MKGTSRNGRVCPLCYGPKIPGRRKCPRDHSLSWESVQYAVHCHPDGLSREEIGLLMGLTRQSIRNIEEGALAHLEGYARRDRTHEIP